MSFDILEERDIEPGDSSRVGYTRNCDSSILLRAAFGSKRTNQGIADLNTYNYSTFVGDDDFLAFRSALPVGSEAPDSVVIDAETGDQRKLSDYWSGKDLVLEFGSFS